MLFNSDANSLDTSAKALRKTSFWFAAIALICLLCADLDISTVDPWHELSLMAVGALSPSVWSWPTLLTSLANTFSFALQGVALAAIAGFILALGYGSTMYPRLLCLYSLNP